MSDPLPDCGEAIYQALQHQPFHFWALLPTPKIFVYDTDLAIVSLVTLCRVTPPVLAVQRQPHLLTLELPYNHAAAARRTLQVLATKGLRLQCCTQAAYHDSDGKRVIPLRPYLHLTTPAVLTLASMDAIVER